MLNVMYKTTKDNHTNGMKNYYRKSLKELKKKLKENKELKEQDWNEYAHQYALFSSLTIMAKEDVESWQELKKDIMFPLF